MRRTVAVIVAASFMLVAGYEAIGPNGLMTLLQQSRERREVEEEVRKLTLENLRLMNRVESLRNNPHDVEALARQEMKLARPGEKIFVLPAPPSAK